MASAAAVGDAVSTARLVVERAGFAQVQDLGRPGYASIGVAANGAGDQRSARLANTLVGNRDSAPIVEVVASAFEFTARGDLLVAATGAVDGIAVNGFQWPAHQPIAVPAGSRVAVPESHLGTRAYLAVNGTVEADRALGSVAPDPLLEFGRRLGVGDELVVDTGFHAADVSPLPVFRVPAKPLRLGGKVALRATRGPDLARLAGGEAALGATFEMTPQSDYIGVRMVGGDLSLAVRDEILSRGVPVGALEVPPSGELIALLRGRLVTAGYPVVAVLTRPAIDRLSQARPGDRVTVELVDAAAARADIERTESEHCETAQRVATALEARGLSHLVDPEHASR